MENKIIYLYIKESPLGLKYLGVTIRNPFTYPGSGTYWTRHLDKYFIEVSDIKTEILFKSYSKDEIKEKGLYYSNLWDIVKSKDWANLIPEAGHECIIISEQVRRKIIKNLGRKIIQYDLEGNFIKKWNSIKEAAKNLNCKPGTIGSCCKNIGFSAGGFRFTYEGNSLTDLKLKYKSHKKVVIQTDKNGNFIKEWNCAADAARFYNTPDTNIFSVCRGKTKSAVGFKWYYK